MIELGVLGLELDNILLERLKVLEARLGRGEDLVDRFLLGSRCFQQVVERILLRLGLVELDLGHLAFLEGLLELFLVELSGLHEFLLQVDGLLFDRRQVVLQHAELRLGVFSLGAQRMQVLGE